MKVLSLRRQRSVSAPPASPRARALAPVMPDVFTYWQRKSDGALFQVRNVYPRDLQIRLERPGEVAFPFLNALHRDYVEWSF